MRINVLDHGYVEFIEAWGKGKDVQLREVHHLDPTLTDYEVGIIEAARQSTQGSFRGWERDMKLLTHLWEHRHNSPFEFAGCTIEVQAPIFVFREWHRHRTQSYNEMSARYTELPDLYYVPEVLNVEERIVKAQTTANKQAGAVAELNGSAGEIAKFWVQTSLKSAYEHAEYMYQDALKAGIPKELARIVMPVGHYSRMRATANLRNWLAFLTLRMDPTAQWEIREYAKALGEQIIAKLFPRTWWLFNAPHEEDRSTKAKLEILIGQYCENEACAGLVDDLRALL